MVVPQVAMPAVEIPDQQAMICFADGVERLVIETAFLGAGTNFAWVVPLPSVPEVKPAHNNFFAVLRQTFQPRLVHEVAPYYAGLLLLCGRGWLGWRSMKEEVQWFYDLPMCLLLAAGAGLMARHYAPALVVLGLATYTRVMTRSSAGLAASLLLGLTIAAGLVYAPQARLYGLMRGLILTMGDGGGAALAVAYPRAEVVSVQRAGIFDSTTIRGADSRGVVAWLEENGYDVPPSSLPAIRDYVARGWVFVASKARRDSSDPVRTGLHPLAFTFATSSPVYPMRLTAANGHDCAVDLYVFGKQRAGARRFRTVRCDRVWDNQPPAKQVIASTALKVSDAEVMALVGDAAVGTKLSARLSPEQMGSDVTIGRRPFWRTGVHVFSYGGAASIALNAAVSLALLAWLLVGACQGGWLVDRRWIRRWRWRGIAAGLLLGFAIFLVLPKTEIEFAAGYPGGAWNVLEE